MQEENFKLIFGKIEYLNLLPFHVFMKRFSRNSQEKMIMEFKKDVPAKINIEFENRRVNAAFISSIKAKNKKRSRLGIVARKEVQSVLVIPQDEYTRDIESATSNVLSNLLGVRGKVLIGDKALKYYLTGAEHIDLAKRWQEKYNLPFVFAVLSYHRHDKQIKKIEKYFSKTKIKIPQYILKQASHKTGIQSKDITAYLTKISYKIDTKALLGLKTFYKQV